MTKRLKRLWLELRLKIAENGVRNSALRYMRTRDGVDWCVMRNRANEMFKPKIELYPRTVR